MTNKTEMVSVPRELLERLIAPAIGLTEKKNHWAAVFDLRALLAAPVEDVRAVVDEPVAYELLMKGEQKDLATGKFGVSPAWENLQRHGYVINPLYRHPQRPLALPERRKFDGWSDITSQDQGWNACLDEFARLNK